jgi:RNA polymerase sigma factor (sigma-70 family)
VYSIYLDSLNQEDLSNLTQEEELALARRKEAGDQEAIKQLFNSCARMVLSIAKRSKLRSHIHLLDAIQEGNLGLLKAIEKFKPWDHDNCRLTTYATWWIRQYIYRLSYDNSASLVRLPLSAQDGSHRSKNPKTLAAVEAAGRGYKPFHPKHHEYGGGYDGSARSLQEKYPDVEAIMPVDKMEEEEEKQFVRSHVDRLLDKLPPRTAHVLLQRARGFTLRELAKELDLVVESIRMIEKEGLTKLRELHAMAVMHDERGNGEAHEELVDRVAAAENPAELVGVVRLAQVEEAIAMLEEQLQIAKEVHASRKENLVALRALLLREHDMSPDMDAKSRGVAWGGTRKELPLSEDGRSRCKKAAAKS